MKYLYRDIENQLNTWINEQDRLPLLIRGARQVGKSSLVKQFGKQFQYFMELNLELNPEISKVFEANLEPHRICDELALIYNTPVEPGRTLLFIDEIQSSLAAISSLRFFYEQYPELHVIAAGSLLEFALSELPSFGVGRIRSLFLYPFSFNEFLLAVGENQLLDAIQRARPEKPLSELVHKKALNLFKRFVIIGGMPKVVSYYVETGDLLKCQQVLDDLVLSLQDDFVKYKKRVSSFMFKGVFNSVVAQNSNKFVYTKATPDLNRGQVKLCLELLSMAGLIYPVTHSSANGIPLGAETNVKFRKYIVFDTGIYQRILGLELSDLILKSNFDSINKGSIAELFVGLELMKVTDKRNELYYWQRESKNSQAEVDYLVQKNTKILPIEVKSGSKGSMQSMFLFLDEKKMDMGIRVSQENFSEYDKIKVFPIYAVANILSKKE
ncbi:MAG: AAA family ATPase [Bacteroidales bacterium]|nr:AAA family ATPase [Bacteroidales bacterium]MCF8458481.1 AAA family ATPase [Bacteroidales bacterium]